MESTNYYARDADAEHPFAKPGKTYSCIQPAIPSPEMPKQFTLWRHYKGGLYIVLGMSMEEGQPHRVIYASVQYGFIWARLLSAWHELVEVGGATLPRFQHFSGGEG